MMVLVTLLGGAYLYWMSTPLYAFQEAALALKDRDGRVFAQRVDINTFIDSLLDDLLVHPAETTPGLNSFQRQVGNGAIALAKTSIEAEALKSVDRIFPRNRMRDLSSLGPDAAIAETPPASSGGNIGDFLRAASHELGGEVSKMQTVVYGRMELWAHAHRATLPGRLLACPARERGTELKQILSDFGLKQENFKGIAACSTTDDGTVETCLVGLNFFCPRVSKEVTVNVEVLKGGTSDCWRISRIANMHQLLLSLGESYEYDVHSLMRTSLAGINGASVQNEVKGVAQRIQQSGAAQNLMQQLRAKLGN